MNKLSANPITSRLRGVTLVELLISLVLGMLLTAGIIQVFAGNRTTYAFNDSLSRIQENARFTLDHISYEARMAGYSGCLADVALHNNLTTADTFRDDIANGIQGYDANGTGAGETYDATAMDPAPSANPADWTPSLPAQLQNLVLPGSDVLVVRGIGGNAQALVSPFTDSAKLFVTAPQDFVIGEILVVSDCQKASIFQLTEANTVGFGVNLVHSAASFTPGNTAPNWGPEQDYGLGSEVARLNTFAFYVGRGADGSPALFRLRLQRTGATTAGFAAEELAAGIETLQVRYALDTDGDGGINSWVSADAIGAAWADVLSVEITLLARADDEYGAETDTVTYTLGATQFNPINDRRLREVFSTTVGVRNRLP
jgi:type IV pilus assembly protein PilW